MPDHGRPGAVTIDKEMAISHREFFRILPGALGGMSYRNDGDRLVSVAGERRVEITLSPESQRRIALLVLPVTHVRLVFTGYEAADMQSFLTRFDRAFQRGGG